MPYDTRRKSLSLPSLGIQLPNASRSHRSSISQTAAERPNLRSSPPHAPSAKKAKRSHADSPSSPTTATTSTHASRSRTTSTSTPKNVSFADVPMSRKVQEFTPPPSPGSLKATRVDAETVNDDIIWGIIQQLEKTGNRPHLIRELAIVLSSVSDSVANSANPGALISSRLLAFLGRDSWTDKSPCPLMKEYTTVHPRKVYFYLSTMARQDLPPDSSDLFPSTPTSADPRSVGPKRIISPSLSSASVDEDPEAAEERKREALSPSPEIDLSHEIDDMEDDEPEMDFATSPVSGTSFSARSSMGRDASIGSGTVDTDLSHNHRAVSPPLEHEEKEFTQTASSVRMRGMSLDEPSTSIVRPSVEGTLGQAEAQHTDDDEESIAKRNREVAATLFGEHHAQVLSSAAGLVSSPLLKPIPSRSGDKLIKSEDVVMTETPTETVSIMGDAGNVGVMWDTRQPEDIELDELDELFSDC